MSLSIAILLASSCQPGSRSGQLPKVPEDVERLIPGGGAVKRSDHPD
jgi:hypothetical protein